MTEEVGRANSMNVVKRGVTVAAAQAGAEKELPRQWVVMRKDLKSTWPTGSLVAQACHASVAALWGNRDDPLTLEYVCYPTDV